MFLGSTVIFAHTTCQRSLHAALDISLIGWDTASKNV